MVDVGVTEQHRIEPGGVEAEGVAVALVAFLAPLDHPAVEQDPPARVLDQVAGTRDLASRAVKADVHRAEPTEHRAVRSLAPSGVSILIKWK